MLLDTSGLLCYLHQDEPQHSEAVRLLNGSNLRLLTHSYVLAELIALEGWIVLGLHHQHPIAPINVLNS